MRTPADACVESGCARVEILDRLQDVAYPEALGLRIHLELTARLAAVRDGGRRVFARLIPWTCVGPPITTRSGRSVRASSASAVGTRWTSASSPTPVAIASAIFRVLPYIDS